jgi:hypothetical protein
MWYVSCTGWEKIAGRWEPHYHVKHAESRDGIAWELSGRSCVEGKPGWAIGRPFVFRSAGRYAMLYSDRAVDGYRTEREKSYRIGYAESDDGLSWQRRDERVGIAKSDNGWDSQMLEYCWMQEYRGNTYLLYNGNGFGQTGFGIARLVES